MSGAQAASPDSALLSGNWYRVAALRPGLRGHVRIHRHVYRGQVWYVVEDRVAGRYHRFNPGAYRAIGLMNGERDMDALWRTLTATIDEDTPSQEDVIRLLGQMHAADLIQCDVDPDVAELFERGERQERRRIAGRYLNPIALRFPLWDPDRFLARLAGWMRPLGGARGVFLWLAVVLPALVMAPSRWTDLTRNFSEQLLSADNLLILFVIFPLLKACHELGHGLAVRLRGGEVHEMGVMLLVFFPVPYVDASASSAFVRKRERMLVGAAGMLTEIFIAALAFYAWVLMEPGLARAIAYNVIVLAGVTTLMFNANPLLRYDGYYVLSDAIEIPNLGTRANRYWQHLAERHLFGLTQLEPPPATPGERRWFVFYAPLAFAYRMFVLVSIALFIAAQYFFIGVVLALWGLVASVGVPLYKGLAALLGAPQYAARARRVRVVLGGVALAAVVFLFVLPMPYHTAVEGVVWLPEQAVLRTRANGFVREVVAAPGTQVAPGMSVLQSIDPTLAAAVRAQAARLEEVRARHDAVWGVNPAQAGQIEEELRMEEAALARMREEESLLTLRAEARGTLVMEQPGDLPGRYRRKGDVVGYVIGEFQPLVRAVVPQPLVDQVRQATRAVEVRLPQDMGRVVPARMNRSVPKARRELPSAALGRSGGGSIAVDPQDSRGVKTLESMFEFEVELPADSPARHIGSRAYVRFEHPAEAIGFRAVRALRRLFLSHFHV